MYFMQVIQLASYYLADSTGPRVTGTQHGGHRGFGQFQGRSPAW